ncbi:hypothetical protein Terro_1554 [Terriglobus roseus DSM 18391]|uniref:Uncharacterized protein n=1 Tax=Terriglobus roseus (strain DSM 18391 / NRRL B-41598 / KBS 63) TaxID=926566 RepID=I3ZF43_TERRK|nr:hypothetical protein [Terriglobus roseus]AFL87861.1 hypothetical protein Terro_1554 [Terriglobus roseus DSM 18391]
MWLVRTTQGNGRPGFGIKRAIVAAAMACASMLTPAFAETCTTQSAMTAADRDALVRAGEQFAALTAANNAEGVRAQTMPQFAQDFGGIAEAIRTAAPKLQGASFVPDTVWILDASTSKPGADGSAQDAQFFCNLNRGSLQTSFLIPALPAGRYALVVLNTAGTADPYQIAMLLRQSATGTWQLGGLFPRATTAGGHDGLWFWKAARDFAAKKQSWNAFVYYNEAEQLLKPVSFLSSSHLESLQAERSKAAPPALSTGISTSQPLVIAPKAGAEVRVTSLEALNAPAQAGIDLLAHVRTEDALTDPVASRARNTAAAKAIVAAYPELRTAFHGVWIVADLPNGTTFVSEEPMGAL